MKKFNAAIVWFIALFFVTCAWAQMPIFRNQFTTNVPGAWVRGNADFGDGTVWFRANGPFTNTLGNAHFGERVWIVGTNVGPGGLKFFIGTNGFGVGTPWFVVTNGLVGVNTLPSGTYGLEVNGSSYGTILVAGNSIYTGPAGSFLWNSTPTPTISRDYAGVVVTPGAGVTNILTINNTNSVPVVVVNSNGNVGLGTNWPQANLHIFGNAYVIGPSNNPAIKLWVGTNGPGSTPWLVVSNSRVGIGTMPVYPLHVAGATYSSGSMSAGSYLATVTGIIQLGQGTADQTPSFVRSNGSQVILRDYVSGPLSSNHLIIPGTLFTSNGLVSAGGSNLFTGNVGIETNSPQAKLHVAQYSVGPQFVLQVSSLLTNHILNLDTNGNMYVRGDVDCLSVTDHSDSPSNTVDAWAIVSSHAVKNGQVDHSRLSPLAYGRKYVAYDTGEIRTNIAIVETVTNIVEIDVDGVPTPTEVVVPGYTNITIEPIMGATIEPDPDKRNLSMMISAQAMTIQDLDRKVKTLETTVADLAARIAKLEAVAPKP